MNFLCLIKIKLLKMNHKILLWYATILFMFIMLSGKKIETFWIKMTYYIPIIIRYISKDFATLKKNQVDFLINRLY